MCHMVKQELGSGCGIWLALAARCHISGNETNSSCSSDLMHKQKLVKYRPWLKNHFPQVKPTKIPALSKAAKLAASWCPWQLLQGGLVLPAMLGHTGMDWAHMAWYTLTQVGWEVQQMLLQSRNLCVTAPQWRLTLLPTDTCEVCSRAGSCTFLLNSLMALKCQWHSQKSSYPY